MNETQVDSLTFKAGHLLVQIAIFRVSERYRHGLEGVKQVNLGG